MTADTLIDKTTVLVASPVVELDGRAGLIELIKQAGHDPQAIPDREKAALGARIAAHVQRPKPWGRSYISAVRDGTLQPSPEFTHAVHALLSAMGGMPAVWTLARPVVVNATVELDPGTLITWGNRRCANPACGRPFLPHTWSHRYCSPECRKRPPRAA